jgi:hypothetical protein
LTGGYTDGQTITSPDTSPTQVPYVVPTQIAWSGFHFPTPLALVRKFSVITATPQKRATNQSITPTVTFAINKSVTPTPLSTSPTPDSPWLAVPNIFPGAKPTQVAIAPRTDTQPDVVPDDAGIASPDAAEPTPASDEPSTDATYYAQRLLNVIFVGGASVLLLAGGALGLLAAFFFLRAKLLD